MRVAGLSGSPHTTDVGNAVGVEIADEFEGAQVESLGLRPMLERAASI